MHKYTLIFKMNKTVFINSYHRLIKILNHQNPTISGFDFYLFINSVYDTFAPWGISV